LTEPAGIVAFQLGQDHVVAPDIVGSGQTLQLHQRRVADEILERLVFHRASHLT
jgi:hypothetical protein